MPAAFLFSRVTAEPEGIFLIVNLNFEIVFPSERDTAPAVVTRIDRERELRSIRHRSVPRTKEGNGDEIR